MTTRLPIADLLSAAAGDIDRLCLLSQSLYAEIARLRANAEAARADGVTSELRADAESAIDSTLAEKVVSLESELVAVDNALEFVQTEVGSVRELLTTADEAQHHALEARLYSARSRAAELPPAPVEPSALRVMSDGKGGVIIVAPRAASFAELSAQPWPVGAVPGGTLVAYVSPDPAAYQPTCPEAALDLLPSLAALLTGHVHATLLPPLPANGGSGLGAASVSPPAVQLSVSASIDSEARRVALIVDIPAGTRHGSRVSLSPVVYPYSTMGATAATLALQPPLIPALMAFVGGLRVPHTYAFADFPREAVGACITPFGALYVPIPGKREPTSSASPEVVAAQPAVYATSSAGRMNGISDGSLPSAALIDGTPHGAQAAAYDDASATLLICAGRAVLMYDPRSGRFRSPALRFTSVSPCAAVALPARDATGRLTGERVTLVSSASQGLFVFDPATGARLARAQVEPTPGGGLGDALQCCKGGMAVDAGTGTAYVSSGSAVHAWAFVDGALAFEGSVCSPPGRRSGHFLVALMPASAAQAAHCDAARAAAADAFVGLGVAPPPTALTAGPTRAFLVVAALRGSTLHVFALPSRSLVHAWSPGLMSLVGLAGDPAGQALALCDSVSLAAYVIPWPLPGMAW